MKRFVLDVLVVALLLVLGGIELFHAGQQSNTWSSVERYPNYTLGLMALPLPVISTNSQSSQAQASALQWSEPRRLKGPYAKAQQHYGLVPDQAGYVHLFWTQSDIYGESVSYSRWDGTTWSTAIDIYRSRDGTNATYVTATIDSAGLLHAIFFSGNERDGRLYYSRAPATDAASVLSWSKPNEIVRGATPTGSMAIDGKGVLQLMYAQQGDALVNAMSSSDGGDTWSGPTPVSGDCVKGSTASSIDIAADATGRLHAVWSGHNERAIGEIVCYARLAPEQAEWSSPTIVDLKDRGEYGLGWASVAAVGKDEIHLIWQGNILPPNPPPSLPPGRLHRWSRDGGETWTSPEQVFDLVGENGLVGPMAVDSSGGLHAISHGRYSAAGGAEIHGLFYIPWERDHWGSRVPIVEGFREDMFDPQSPRLVSYLGNRLLALYGNDPPRGLWFSTAKTGAPLVPPKPYPTPQPTPIPTAAKTAAIKPIATPVPVVVRPAAGPAEPVADVGSVMEPSLIGWLSGALLVSVVVFVRFRRVFSDW